MLRIARWYLRALILKCPLCGHLWPRRRWVELAPQCPHCDLYLERRENDFFLGAYTVSLLATLTLAMIGSWTIARAMHAPSWVHETILIALIVIFALGFYPFGKLLWLATDLLVRPPLEKDFDEEIGRG